MGWSIGSTWHRWDPHIHAPGTSKENQYGSSEDETVCQQYFKTIQKAQPQCSALGITDYFVPRGYRLFIERKGPCNLPGLFVFPNIELRLKTRAEKGNTPNVHLLVSPEADDHLTVITSKLAELTFTYDDEKFRCTEDDLRRLGRVATKNRKLEDEAALKAGAACFLIGKRSGG